MYENIRAGMIKEAKTGVMKKDGGENRKEEKKKQIRWQKRETTKKEKKKKKMNRRLGRLENISEDAVIRSTAESKREERGGVEEEERGVEKCCTQAVWPGATWLMKQPLLSTQPCGVCTSAQSAYVYMPGSNVRVYVSALKDGVEQSDDSQLPLLLAEEINAAALMQTDGEAD